MYVIPTFTSAKDECMAYQLLIYGLCGGSLFLLSLLLLFNFPKVNRRANSFLAICSFFLSSVFVQLLLETSNISEYTVFLPFLEFGRWAIFPCFFVAIQLYISPNQSYKQYTVHFVPTIILWFLLWSPFSLPDVFRYIIRYFLYGQFLVYGIWSFVLLYKHELFVRTFSANPKEINLRWIRNVWLGILLLVISSLILHFFLSISPLIDSLYLIGVLFFCYHALSQTAIYPVADKQVPVIKAAIQSKDKERLTAEQIQFFKERLLQLMNKEQLYLDSQLNLPYLADKVGLSVHELSYVLNTGINLNFYQFINGYRVRYARQLLIDNIKNNYTIQEITFRAGFNSKTTFYTAFKQEVGMTPKQYLNERK